MPVSRIRADYDALTKVSQSFARQAAAAQTTVQKIQQCVDTLKGGDWIGKGATAFYREMEADVLPALHRLADALNEASRLAQQASQIMHQAEDDAAGVFRAVGLGGIAGGVAAGLGTISGLSGGAATGGIGFDEFEDFLADYVGQYGSFQGTGDVLQLERPETDSPYSTGTDSKYGAGGGGESAGSGGGGGGSGSGNAGTLIESKGDKFAGGAGLRASGVSLGSHARGFAAKGSLAGGSAQSLSARGGIGLNIGGANVGVSLKAGAKPSIGLKVGRRMVADLPIVNLGVHFAQTKK
jgi:WXG100 family type VII secretion target